MTIIPIGHRDTGYTPMMRGKTTTRWITDEKGLCTLFPNKSDAIDAAIQWIDQFYQTKTT